MSTIAQRSARAALDAARAAVARLDSARGPEDLAADLIETWTAVETALRTLISSSDLSGQALIREARQRQAINFEQANALAELQAVHDRLQNTSYRPTDVDINAARGAFLKLDSTLVEPAAVEAPRPAPRDPTLSTGRAASPPPVATPVPEPTFENDGTAVRRGLPSGAILGGVVGLALLIAVGAFFMFGRRKTDAFQQGVDAYAQHQREAAVSAFNKAVRDNPQSAAPHIYLARMAREVGNFTLASQELQLALQAEPNNALALREMGANLLTQGNYELARRFYVRAVQADPTDKIAQGYLGCTLMRLNRPADAQNFLNRAGPGAWSNCTAAPPGQPVQPGLPAAAVPRP